MERKKRKAFVNTDDCVACGCCIKVCSRNAIEIWKGIMAKVAGQKTAHHKLSAQHVHLRGFCGAVSAVRPSACRRTHQ